MLRFNYHSPKFYLAFNKLALNYSQPSQIFPILAAFLRYCSGPWLFLGDFNPILIGKSLELFKILLLRGRTRPRFCKRSLDYARFYPLQHYFHPTPNLNLLFFKFRQLPVNIFQLMWISPNCFIACRVYSWVFPHQHDHYPKFSIIIQEIT